MTMENSPFIFAMLAMASGIWLIVAVAMHLWKHSDRRYKTVSAEEFKRFKEHMKRLETEHLEKELLSKFNSLEDLRFANRRLDKCRRKYNSY